ncbi:MAG: MMPL family transporter, partial [Schleiferiaceae bacterium]|nr:MMPL family transporter [Schleiferiaceae bacterium]
MRKLLNKKSARLTLGIISLFTIMFAGLCTQVEFSYDFERFFPTGNQDFELYQEFKTQLFSSDSRTIIAVETPGGLFNQETLRNLKKASDSLQKSEIITEVVSLTRLNYPIETPMGLVQLPYVDPEHPENFEEDSLRIFHSKNLKGAIVANDFKSTVVSVFTDFYLSKGQTDTVNNLIKTVFKHYGFTDLHYGGRLLNQAIILDKMKSEMAMFISLSVAFVVLALFIVFRTFWGIAIPVMIIIATAIWTVGYMVIFGKEIDVLSSLIPSILFIVGVSDVIHIYSKYIDGLRAGLQKDEAIWKAYRQVGLATFITSVTTSIGFLSLLLSGISPIREFGIYMALGVMTAFALSFTLFPSCLILLPEPKITKNVKTKDTWESRMSRLHDWVMNRKGLVITSSTLIFALCIWGTSQLKVNNYLTEELPKGDELRTSFDFLEEHFSGMRTFDLFVTLKDSTQKVYDYEVLEQLDQIEKYLEVNNDIGALISPVTLVKQLNQAKEGGQPEYYTLPKPNEFKKLKRTLRQAQKNKLVSELVVNEGRTARITGNMKDNGGYINLRQNDELIEHFNAKFPNLELKVLGMAHFIDVNNRYVSTSMIKSLGLAFLMISVLMAFLYKSVRIILIAIVPNVLPLLIIGFLMYLFGVDIKVSTALIFTISYGIAVDDTIHFLGNMKIELSKGKSVAESIKSTFITTGKSIILTTVILFAG